MSDSHDHDEYVVERQSATIIIVVRLTDRIDVAQLLQDFSIPLVVDGLPRDLPM